MPSEPEEDREVGSENEQNMELELVDATTKRSEDEVVQTVGRQDKDKDADEDGKNTTETGRKEMAPRSEMWQHFIKIKDDQGVLKKGKCKYCSRPIKADPYVNGTTALHRHFNICKRNPHNLYSRLYSRLAAKINSNKYSGGHGEISRVRNR
jgi:hypothetical protein